MTPEEFYSRLGDAFGIIGPNRTQPHRGQDFPWGAGTDIPSWCDGTVALVGYTPVIGHFVSIRLDGGAGWAGHCHMLSRSPLELGARVLYGDLVGDVGNTGSASRGNHDHATFSPWGVSPATARVVDPLPWIRSAIASKAPQPPKRKRHDMPRLMRRILPRPAGAPTSGDGKYSELALYDELGRFQVFTNLQPAGAERSLFDELWAAYGPPEEVAPGSALERFWKRRTVTLGPEQRQPYFDSAGNPVAGPQAPGSGSFVLELKGTAEPS